MIENMFLDDEPEMTIVCHPSVRERIEEIVNFLRPDGRVAVIPSTLVPTDKIYLFRQPKIEIDARGLFERDRKIELYKHWLDSRQPWPPPAGNISNINVS